MNRAVRSPLFAAVLLACVATLSRAQAARPDFSVTNGIVRAMSLAGNMLYVGGDFSWVGFPTGPAVTIDSQTGDPSHAFPRFDGSSPVIDVAIPDGSGGWYMGGTFTPVGSAARTNLAHVLANNTVASWNPAPDGEVKALALRGTALLVGGTFSSIGGQNRTNLAAVDVSTGLATAWAPQPDGEVDAIVSDASVVYAGGSFSNAGGQVRSALAALNPTTAAATAWD